jgi:hypothetical protein
MSVKITIKDDAVVVSGGGLNRVSFSKKNALSMNKSDFKDAFSSSLHGYVDTVWNKIGGAKSKKTEKKSEKSDN